MSSVLENEARNKILPQETRLAETNSEGLTQQRPGEGTEADRNQNAICAPLPTPAGPPSLGTHADTEIKHWVPAQKVQPSRWAPHTDKVHLQYSHSMMTGPRNLKNK